MRPASRQYPREDRARVVSRDARDLVPVRRGLGAMWRADVGRTMNAGTVSAWRDLGTGAGDVAQGTAANQPTLVAQATGARAALRFDGSNDSLARAAFAATSASARGLSIVFVVQGRSGSTGDFPPVLQCRPWSGNDNGWAITANGSGSSGRVVAYIGNGTSSAFINATRGISTTQRELWAAVFDDVNDRITIYRNGQIDARSSVTFPTGNSPTANFIIGADAATTPLRVLAMDLYAAAIHTEPLTDREVATYWARWAPLYGVQP